MESPEQTIRRLQRKLRQSHKELRQKDRTLDSLRRRQGTEDGLRDVTKEGNRHMTDVPLLHTRETVNNIPSDGGKLATMTSFGTDKSGHITGGSSPGQKSAGVPRCSLGTAPQTRTTAACRAESRSCCLRCCASDTASRRTCLP